jgi:predicted MFS family arabinose efflux permease
MALRVGRLPRPVAFWLVGAALGMLMFAASAPSPLYVVYQAEWRFSTTTLTGVFAVYVLALLLTLLLTGSLSDAIGRRPVLAGALLVEICGMALFAAARDVTWLFAARIVQGLATGAATGALSASLLDLGPPGNPRLGPLVNGVAPSAGLALGALGTGLLVQYGPAPTHLVFLLLISAFTVATLGTVAMREPVGEPALRLGSLRPRVGVPRGIRARFVAAAPCLVATCALGGFYLSLGPSVAVGILHVASHLVGGLVIFALAGSGAVTAVLLRSWEPRRAMLAGAVSLAVGVGLTLLALWLRTTPVFFGGTVVAGFGFGAALQGAFRTLSALARVEERAGLIAAIYIVCYLAFSLPALAAGVAVTAAGLSATTLVYGGAIAALGAGAAAVTALQGRHDRAPEASREVERAA